MEAVPLGLRLFLEGVEIPVISSQVMLNPDQPSVAQIQIIPTDMGLHLLPRTLVHLFYFDSDILPKEIEEMLSEQEQPRLSPGSEAEEMALLDTRYKTMFQGELIGFNYTKSPVSRSLILQCMDLSSYWDTCYQWFADYSAQGSGLTDVQHNFVGAKEGLFDNIAGGHKWVIGRILNTKPRTPEFFETKGLLGGIIHLMEAIGGIRYRGPLPHEKGFNGVNDFFTIAELRYNLLGMLGAVEKDDTSAKMYASKAFRSWLRNGMTSLGSLLSFRDILNHVNRYIFHHIYPNPCAYYRTPSSEKRTRTRTATIRTYLGESPAGALAIQDMKVAFNNLVKAQNFFAAAALVAGTDPESEEFYAPQHFEAKENFNKGWSAFVDASRRIEAAQDIVESLLTSNKDAPKVNWTLWLAKDKIDPGIQLMSGINPREDEIPNIGNRALRLSELSEQAADALKDKIKPIRKKVKQTIAFKEGPRLYSQLILPETFFVSPPRCNVIFPDQYHQFSYSRNFMREVTRLSCAGGIGLIAGRRGAKLFGHHYFAPNIKDVRGNTLRLTTQYGGRVLLPHEVHSGIIPKFEWVTDGHRWGVKASKDANRTTPVYRSGKVGYIQRLANFQFFLHRWSSRAMALSGIFMPNLVLGLPGVVINTSAPSVAVMKAIEKKLGYRPLPVQYLGKIASVTHAVNQQGGNTSVRFTQSRTHRALDDEFMGVLNREVEIMRKHEFEEEFQPELLAENPSEGGKLRSAFLKIIRMYLDGKLKKGAWVPQLKARVKDFELYGNVVLTQGQARSISVTEEQLNTTLPIHGYNLVSIELQPTDDVNALSLPQAFSLTFERSVGTGEFREVELSVEEALAPGWYSPVWANKNIGEDVYTPLLGTLAITDNVDIRTDDQDELLNKQYEEQGGAFGEMLTAAGENTSKDLALVGTKDGQRLWKPKTGSIEEAIDSIVTIYSLLKNEGGDVHSFIRQFTKRPIANIENVLGTQNLEFGPDGNPKEESPDMVEGFHSRAFGDYNTDVKMAWREGVNNKAGKNALLGLFPGKGTSSVPRGSIIDRGEEVAIDPRMDPRGRARARVEAYSEELKVSRGLVG